MSKITLAHLLSGFLSNNKLNSNFTKITTALENTLSRDGTSPNAMGAALDMGHNPILNVGAPTGPNDAVRLQDIVDITDGVAIEINTNWTDIVGKPTNFPTNSANVSDFASATRAVTAAQLVAGTNVTITPVGSTLVLASTGSGGSSSVPSLIDYGAVCDGVTDDTTAVNDAIADVNAGTINGFLVPGLTGVTGALTAISNKSVAIYGLGVGISGFVHLGGGDVTMLTINQNANTQRVSIRDLGFYSNQVNLGQALFLNLYWGSNTEMHNVEVKGYGTFAKGFNRGIETVDLCNGNFENVNIPGMIDNTQPTYVGKHTVMSYAWYTRCTVGRFAINNRWHNCDVNWVDTAWKGRGHMEGFTWVTCAPGFVNKCWDVIVTDTTNSPYFSWVNCQMEYWYNGIILDNAAYVNVMGCQFYGDSDVNTARTAVKITSTYKADVNNNFFIAIGPQTGSPLGTDDFLIYGGSTVGGRSSQNSAQDITRYGVWHTDTATRCLSDGDTIGINNVTGFPYHNDAGTGANLLSNHRRRMTILDVLASTQGVQVAQAEYVAASTFGTTQTAYLQIPFAVEPGDKIRVQLGSYASYNNVEGQITAVVREYNHRPASGTPFTILQLANSRVNWSRAKYIKLNVSMDAYFEDIFEFDVVAGATDALISFELVGTTGGIYNHVYSQMKVERL